MIALFPKFDPLSINAHQEINDIILKLPPYSDFNFVSMFSWDIHNTMLVSRLGSNLVVKFKDYTSDGYFLSFIGNYEVDKTIKKLIGYAKGNGMPAKLHLIPEHVVSLIRRPADFHITEDRDSHDYIVLALQLSEMKGKKYASKRNGVNKFHAAHEKRAELKELTINASAMQEIVQTFHDWRHASERSLEDAESELMATEKLLKHADNFDLSVLGVYLDDVMVAYSIYEVQGEYAVGHFEKAIKSHPGLYDYLKHATANELLKKGVRYINYEQDLGIEGLRQAKLLLHPESFLKKFTISMKE